MNYISVYVHNMYAGESKWRRVTKSSVSSLLVGMKVQAKWHALATNSAWFPGIIEAIREDDSNIVDILYDDGEREGVLYRNVRVPDRSGGNSSPLDKSPASSTNSVKRKQSEVSRDEEVENVHKKAHLEHIESVDNGVNGGQGTEGEREAVGGGGGTASSTSLAQRDADNKKKGDDSKYTTTGSFENHNVIDSIIGAGKEKDGGQVYYIVRWKGIPDSRDKVFETLFDMNNINHLQSLVTFYRQHIVFREKK
jgi:hypothetical protein